MSDDFSKIEYNIRTSDSEEDFMRQFEDFSIMTRFLKLVRHEDGKWKALPNETDDLSPVSVKERTYAPIDPRQLLQALDSLLSKAGGINSFQDVPRLASLMTKFSKKLVSRCIYCNVLQKTEIPILSEYLDKGGWSTINIWLEYSMNHPDAPFLVQMLNLCLLLPMTLERLRENNTPKFVKSLTKHENNEVKTLASELVKKWMGLIPKSEKKAKEKKQKKNDSAKKEKGVVKAPPKSPVKLKGTKRSSTEKEAQKSESSEDMKIDPEPPVRDQSPKNSVKLKGTKRPSTEKETKKVESYEDVKIDPEPLVPVSKKLKPDRPKTAKVFQTRFRSTGLEEETLLPKNISKKSSTVDKTAAVAAAKSVLKLHSIPPNRVTENKLKPETLAAIHENSSSNKGIKLIPAKPRPAYVLHESASFMDALISQPSAPVVKKKKKAHPNTANSPTSPTMAPPKLQFYKDTLDMNEENVKKEEDKKENCSDEKGVEVEAMEVTTEEGGDTPPNNESNEASNTSTNNEESKGEAETPSDPNQLRSILSHGKRRGEKKSVRWVEETNIKEVFYFEMDETERVNVLKQQQFESLKTLDVQKEKEAVVMSKRQKGDKMEEQTSWRILVRIDTLPPLAEPGSQSTEKETQRIREDSTLQELYFTKASIPDSPREPDFEITPPQEPKIIPLDEDNLICPLTDFSNYKKPALPILPEVLSSIIRNSIPSQMANNLPEQMPMDHSLRNQPIMDPMNQPNDLMQAMPYDPADPLSSMTPNSHLCPTPIAQNMYGPSTPHHLPTPSQNMVPQAEWRTLDMVQDQYFGCPGPNGQNGNHNMMPMQEQSPGLLLRPRMMLENFRPAMHNGPRSMGPRPRNIHRIPCRHFIAGGCRFGMKCSFLHPGVNGPL